MIYRLWSAAVVQNYITPKYPLLYFPCTLAHYVPGLARGLSQTDLRRILRERSRTGDDALVRPRAFLVRDDSNGDRQWLEVHWNCYAVGFDIEWHGDVVDPVEEHGVVVLIRSEIG